MNPKTRQGHPDGLLDKILGHLNIVSGPNSRGEYVAWCHNHNDDKGLPDDRPNLHISQRGYYCFSCKTGGSLRRLAVEIGIEVPDREPESTYLYVDEHGQELFEVVRLSDKRFYQRRPDGVGGYVNDLRGVRRVLYNLSDLVSRPNESVYVVEGERDADTLMRAGLLATTNPGGAKKWRDEYSDYLADRDVIVLPDNDEVGKKHARLVAKSLLGKARCVTVLLPPGLPDKGDVTDWLEAGNTVEELARLSKNALCLESLDGTNADTDLDQTERSKSQAKRIISAITEEGVVLFHDDVSDTFARIKVNGHYEIHPCRGHRFKVWLGSLLWRKHGDAPSNHAIGAALNVIEGRALFDGDCYGLQNRVAFHDGAFWYDLADQGWLSVRITTDGWKIVNETPILFRRYDHQAPQTEPVHSSANLFDLFGFLNIQDQTDQKLLLVWLVSCFVPNIPHPILLIYGPQGSAKTTASRFLRDLIDPSAIKTIALPNKPREVVQQLAHHYAPFYDNVGSLPSWLLDTLCRASTGEGFSARELYSDDEDRVYKFRRCVAINAINIPTMRPDFASRCLPIRLEPISEHRRKTEKALIERFEKTRATLLGAVFSILSQAMKIHPTIHAPCLPRMADFGEWGCAVAEAIGWSQSDFLTAYKSRFSTQATEDNETDPVVEAISELLDLRGSWSGEPEDLLHALCRIAKERGFDTHHKLWPRSASWLSRRLKESLPALKARGVSCTVGDRKGGRRCIRIIKDVPEPVNGSPRAVIVADMDSKGTVDSTLASYPHASVHAAQDGRDATDTNSLPLEKTRGREGERKKAAIEPQDPENGVSSVLPVHAPPTPYHARHYPTRDLDGRDGAKDASVHLHSLAELPDRIPDWPEYWRDRYEERAAILEIDAGMTCAEAKQKAEEFTRYSYQRETDNGR